MSFVTHPVTIWNPPLQTFCFKWNFNGEYLTMLRESQGFVYLHISIQCFKNHIHLNVYRGEDIQLFRREMKKKKLISTSKMVSL